MTKLCNSAAEALSCVKSGDTLWSHSMAATPVVLLEALAEKAKHLENLTVIQLHLEHAKALADSKLFGRLRNRCYFAGSTMRKLINSDQADYVPIFLSDIPKLFRSGEQPIDVALIQVSPPDRHGNCSLGISVEATRAACDMATTIVAHINPSMPRTLGDSVIPYSSIDFAFEKDSPMFPFKRPEINDICQKIGQNVAGLIRDGDCLQTGIGAIPDAALACLGSHRNLGVHTEMFSDGVMELVKAGVVNNLNKKTHRGKIVTGFVQGTQDLYDFVDDNTEVAFLDIEYVNNPSVIAKNDQVVSINSAIQVDLSGQVCADSIGSSIFSGVGGQVDFVMGSQLSRGGRSIIALPSTAAHGTVSRIVPTLTPGAGVVTTRAHVDYIVTEYGVAHLHGKSLKERAQALLSILHPDWQEEVARQAREQLHFTI